MLTVNALFLLCVLSILLLCSGNVELNPGPGVVNFYKKLSMCHINIRSLSRSKLLAIKTSLSDTYDVITLSETHLHPGVTNDLFILPGYHEIIRKDRTGQGGGVAIFIKENVIFKRIFELESASIEALWLQVNTIQGKVLICCCYRPPTDIEFWNNFDGIMEDAKARQARYIVVLGDLNADFKTPNGNKLKELCFIHNLNCLVNEPTRITATSATVLDQIMTNAPNFVHSVCISPQCLLTITVLYQSC